MTAISHLMRDWPIGSDDPVLNFSIKLYEAYVFTRSIPRLMSWTGSISTSRR